MNLNYLYEMGYKKTNKLNIFCFLKKTENKNCQLYSTYYTKAI